VPAYRGCRRRLLHTPATGGRGFQPEEVERDAEGMAYERAMAVDRAIGGGRSDCGMTLSGVKSLARRGYLV